MNSPKTVDQLDAEIKELQAQRDAALAASKADDLETVKRLCKQHGFTATNLRGYLKIKGKGKKVEEAEADTKTTIKPKSTTTKKTSAEKA